MAVNSGDGLARLLGRPVRKTWLHTTDSGPAPSHVIDFSSPESGILVISHHFPQFYTTLPHHFPQFFHHSAVIPRDHARSEAVVGNHICCAEELVAHGALSERRDAHGQPVLQKAAERCGERMVEILVEVPWPSGSGSQMG